MTTTPKALPALPTGWPARFRCDSCDGNGVIGEPIHMGHFQPPERERCPDCGGRGWSVEEDAFNGGHMHDYAQQAIADSLASAGGVEVEIDRLRDALEHIQKVCVLSRTQSRRIRWIETRAHGALIGDDRLHSSIDLPKDGGPDTAEKLRRRMLQDRHTFRVAQGLAAGILSAALSKEREVADGLRAELEDARQQQAAALDLVSRIRFALGDNGQRMQDELIEWCKGLEAAQRDADRLGWIQAHDSIDIEQVQRECPDDADLWMVTGYSPEGAEHKVLGHGPSLREAIDSAIEAAKEG